MKLLVTGSAGTLGRALVTTFRRDGHSVTGLDRLAGPTTDCLATLTDRAALDAALRGIDGVVHTATLQKPHLATHARQDFLDTNLSGTLQLLEAAVAAGVRSFVFTSSTSTWGDALSPPVDEPAAWITESVPARPRTLYGLTKTTAEDLCRLIHRDHGLPVVVLRTARFFERPDEAEAGRLGLDPRNLQVVEFLNRRVDLRDAVSAHRAALERAPAIGFGRFIVSATSPFEPDDRAALRGRAAEVVAQRVPGAVGWLAALGWRVPDDLDRVYVNTEARTRLDWTPEHDFARVLAEAADGRAPAALQP